MLISAYFFFPSLQEKEEQRVRKEILALANEGKWVLQEFQVCFSEHPPNTSLRSTARTQVSAVLER